MIKAGVKVEGAVHKRCIQESSAGQPTSGPILCEKAVMFNTGLGGTSNFTANYGWLHIFKSLQRAWEIEILSANKKNAEKFFS